MGNLVRVAVSFSVPLLSLLAGNAPAAAQRSARPGHGGPLPASLDLRKVPLGSWAEYRTTYVGMDTPITERYGLVGRTGANVDIETESPEMASELVAPMMASLSSGSTPVLSLPGRTRRC